MSDILFCSTIMVRQPLLWLPVEKLKLVLCFTTYRKFVRVNRRRSYSDSLHQKSLISDYICRSYWNISQGSVFLRHSVECIINQQSYSAHGKVSLAPRARGATSFISVSRKLTRKETLLGMKTTDHFTGHLAGALGPDLTLKLASRIGLDRRCSQVGFGPRAGLCRPLMKRLPKMLGNR